MDTPQPDAISLSLLAHEGHCKGCGYSLRALTLPRCPECGRPFDPDDPTTMDLPEHLRPPKPPEPFGNTMVGAAVVVTIFAMANFLAPQDNKGDALLAEAVLLIAWILISINWYWRDQARPEQLRLRSEGYAHWRRILKIAALLSMLSCFHYHSCCHANTVWLGSIGISHSNYGGPCYIPPHNGGKRISGNWYWAL